MPIEVTPEKLPELDKLSAGDAAAPAPPPPFVGILRRTWAFVLDCMLLYLLGRGLDRIARPALLELNPELPWLGFALTFVYFWLGNGPVGHGRTLGKVIMHLCVVDAQGRPLRLRAAFRRAVIQVAGLFIFLGMNPAYATLIFPSDTRFHAAVALMMTMLLCLAWFCALVLSTGIHPYKRGWHDEWAGSYETWAPVSAAFFDALNVEPDPITAGRLRKHKLITVIFWGIATAALLIFPLRAITLPEVAERAHEIAVQQQTVGDPVYQITQSFTADENNRRQALDDVVLIRAQQMQQIQRQEDPNYHGEKTVLETTATLLARAELDGETNLVLEMKRRGAVTEAETQGADFRNHAEKVRAVLWKTMQTKAPAGGGQRVVARRFTLLLYEPFQLFFNNGTVLRARASGPARPGSGGLHVQYFSANQPAPGETPGTALAENATATATQPAERMHQALTMQPPEQPNPPAAPPGTEHRAPETEAQPMTHAGGASEKAKRVDPQRAGGLAADEIDKIPQLPGVYIMHDADGKVLYIGKALNLRSRVNSYFTKAGDARFNVRFLMRYVTHVETVITSNEKEAFLLENNLIKEHQPRYNIRLRDDKTYVSVRINLKHEWPRAVVMRRRNEQKSDSGTYLGPYSSAASVRDTLRHLQRIFPIRSCPDHVLRNRARPCLLHSIGRCCAPCCKPVDKGAYAEMVEGTVLFLKGKTHEVIAKLREKMVRHSGNMEFEAAAQVRDRIAAIEVTTEKQGMYNHGGGDRDVMVLEQKTGTGAFVVFVYRNGILVSSRPFLIKDHERLGEDLMDEFIARYYEAEPPPRELLVWPKPTGCEFLEEWLSEKREARTEIHAPQRGEKLRLVEVARENARKLLDQHLSGEKNVTAMLQEVGEKLGVSAPPEVIECYDISTIQGFATVGSMVTFRGGEPDKSRYRRFRIKSLAGQDDFGALREMLTRRFRRVASGEEPPPGLVIIDGGKGQLGIAVDVFAELRLALPVAGMAKSRVKHRGEEIYRTEERFFLPGRKNPIVFKPNSPALYLLQRLRDEAHRFGITYHRELRGRRNLRSALEGIPGVGKIRASVLLRHFGSLKRMREATVDELATVRGMPRELAERVYEFLQSAAHDVPLEQLDALAAIAADEAVEPSESAEVQAEISQAEAYGAPNMVPEDADADPQANEENAEVLMDEEWASEAGE